MSWFWRVIKKCFYGRKPHVTFSKMTLKQDRERMLLNMASPIPFQNFLNELRLTALDEQGVDRMTLRESASMRRSAVRLWGMLTDQQKDRYREIAVNSNITRISLTKLMESKSNLQLPNNGLVERVPSGPLTNEASATSGSFQRRRPRCGRPPARACSIAGKRNVCSGHGVKKAKKPKKITKPLRKCIKKSIRKCSPPTPRPNAVKRATPPMPVLSKSRLGKRRYSQTDLCDEGFKSAQNSHISIQQSQQSANRMEPLALVRSSHTEMGPLHSEPKRRRRE